MKLLRLLWVALLLLVADVHGAPLRLDFGPSYTQVERILGLPGPALAVWIDLRVGCGEKVEVGQKIAVQRNALGRVVLEYLAPAKGRVEMTAHGRDGEPGNTILEIEALGSRESCIAGDCSEVVAH